MICPSCKANLVKLNNAGEPMIRGKGLVLKADHVAMICPKCSGDVRLSGSDARAVANRILLIFKAPQRKT